MCNSWPLPHAETRFATPDFTAAQPEPSPVFVGLRGARRSAVMTSRHAIRPIQTNEEAIQ